MKWGCANAAPLGRAPKDGDYYGHTLERVTIAKEIGDAGNLYWRCQWCRESFAITSPDGQEPLMETIVEVEDMPTDPAEAAALLLAMFASTPPRSLSDAEDAMYGRDPRYDVAEHKFHLDVASIVSEAWSATFKEVPRGMKRYVRASEAEAFIWHKLGRARR